MSNQTGPDRGTRPSAACADVHRWLERCSLEVSNRRAEDVDRCLTLLRPGTRVFVAFGPKDSWSESLATATRLRQGGLNPVPHIAARGFRSLRELDGVIQRLRDEARVDTIFLIGGDLAHPTGPFSSAIDVLEMGLLAKHGMRGLGLAGYPEGHPHIADDVLSVALARKLELAAQQRLDAFVVTQFAFDAAPIAAWLRRYRELGLSAPVRIGVAGPASISTLVKFGLRCGVGASLRALTARGGSFVRLARQATPDSVLDGLAKLSAVDAAPAEGIHFFTFGGVPRLVRWLNNRRCNAAIASISDGLSEVGGLKRLDLRNR
jgi:methylenetetrahydrofolate reductase (NADPH)